jgi:cytochrome c peroxidase
MSRMEARRRAATLAKLGRLMFFDASLSNSGRMSCSSCHDPAYAYGPPEHLAAGARAVPSLRYLQAIPQFTEHYFDEDKGDDSVDNGPTGGLTWDGRVDRGRDQARIPLLSADEMGNASPATVVARVRKAKYAGEVRRFLGDEGFGKVSQVFGAVLEALETFEQDYREFYPYSSKFDAWMAGEAALTAQEERGLAAFRDPEKGNCASCHTADRGTNGTLPQFTDYGFATLGVPRNRALAANADPNYFDMGLCGPVRADLREHKEYCGMFITPSLRNVARRSTFFHNGVFGSLKDAVTFYATRDTQPSRWYRGDKFDDLPVAYRENVNTAAPFGGKPGGKAALSDGEIDDIVKFLGTLSDGYQKVVPRARL